LNTFINTTETLYPNKPSPKTIYSNIISIGKLKILIIYSHSIFGRKGRRSQKVAFGRFWSLKGRSKVAFGQKWLEWSQKGRSKVAQGR
jgi:hypothetical protein